MTPPPPQGRSSPVRPQRRTLQPALKIPDKTGSNERGGGPSLSVDLERGREETREGVWGWGGNEGAGYSGDTELTKCN